MTEGDRNSVWNDDLRWGYLAPSDELDTPGAILPSVESIGLTPISDEATDLPDVSKLDWS